MMQGWNARILGIVAATAAFTKGEVTWSDCLFGTK